MATYRVFLLALLLPLMFACGGSSSSDGQPTQELESRSFFLGFTPWYFAATQNAISITYGRLNSHGDIIKHHLMEGIPWQEALDQTPYHPNVEASLETRLANTATSMTVFLAVDSLNSSRDELSLYWAESDNLPRQNDWSNRSWSSPEVIAAYVNFASDMIDRFSPTYFEYGTEVSELILNDLDAYADFLVFAEAVYTQLKARYPQLVLVTSVALKSPSSSEMQLVTTHYAELLPYTDLVGISTYPYVFYNHADRGDPSNLPANWLTQIRLIAPGKPYAISETGWIAEDLTIADFQYSEQSDQTKQYLYLEKLLAESENLDMAFVIWWTATDFDTLWENELAQDPVAKIWKDIGLYDEAQQPRQALATWQKWFERPRDE
ncbi:MAG: hypothetical protein HWE13_12020 [Gammaproteobacteria bacterium]|nr:hypothetical protein [Gammaproteobacteria bacterium]